MQRDLLRRYWASIGWTPSDDGETMVYAGYVRNKMCLPDFYRLEQELMAQGWRFAMRDGRFLVYRPGGRCIGGPERDDVIVTAHLETRKSN